MLVAAQIPSPDYGAGSVRAGTSDRVFWACDPCSAVASTRPADSSAKAIATIANSRPKRAKPLTGRDPDGA